MKKDIDDVMKLIAATSFKEFLTAIALFGGMALTIIAAFLIGG